MRSGELATPIGEAQAHARRRAFSGEELVEMIDSEGGATAIAGAIRDFRNRAKRALLVEAKTAVIPDANLQPRTARKSVVVEWMMKYGF